MTLYLFVITLFSAVTKYNPLDSPTKAVPNLNERLANSAIYRQSSQAKGWRYEQTVDRTGVTVYKASLSSANLFQVAYPYSGKTAVTLTLRAKGGDTHVYLEILKGLFTRSFQNGSALVGFDGKRPVTYLLSAAANGRANIVFFDSESQLIRQMKAAKSMVIQLQFAGQASQTLRFDTAGLKWNH